MFLLLVVLQLNLISLKLTMAKAKISALNYQEIFLMP